MSNSVEWVNELVINRRPPILRIVFARDGARFLAIAIALIVGAGCGSHEDAAGIAATERVLLGLSDDTSDAGAGDAAADGMDGGAPAGEPEHADLSTPAGAWYLNANGARLELVLSHSDGVFYGTIRNEGGASEGVSNVTWDAAGRWLEFRRNGPDFFQWYRLSLVEGVVNGRFSHATNFGKPSLPTYRFHVTGWSPDYLDDDIVPRTWQVAINHDYQGVLRVDRDAQGVLRSRLKIHDNSAAAGIQEELEYDLDVVQWDGVRLSFVRTGPTFSQRYTATSNGRFLTGTFTHNEGAPLPWFGSRAEVLGFGLGSRLAERATWQERTRRRLVNLTEGMRLAASAMPAPTVVPEGCEGCPFTGARPYWGERDDDPERWPPNYALQRLRFSVEPSNRFDPANPPPPREFFGYLATPGSAPPAGGYRVMVAVNGHGGDAQQVMSKDSLFWYGESAARRQMVVLAVDIGHRAEWNSPPVHAAIVGAGYTTSDWEEDGERAFNVLRAVDYLAGLPNLQMDRLVISGLSMGGEVATVTSWLDRRVAMTIASGYSPDMHLMDIYGNHACYRWKHASIHEYVSISDYQALTAPRALVIETGMRDFIFSPLGTPWASDKQVTRRARAAYGLEANRLVHYLHYDAHNFHVGDLNPTHSNRPLGITELSAIEASDVSDLSWQTSTATVLRSPSLYHLIDEFLR